MDPKKAITERTEAPREIYTARATLSGFARLAICKSKLRKPGNNWAVERWVSWSLSRSCWSWPGFIHGHIPDPAGVVITAKCWHLPGLN